MTNETDYEIQRKEHVNLATLAYETAKGIRDDASFNHATDVLLKIKSRRNKWREFIDPMVRAAKQAYDAALGKRREIEEPLRQAEEDILKPAIGKWEQKQEEIRKVKEDEIKKQTGADVVLPRTTRQDGIQYRTLWKADVTNMREFVKAVDRGQIPIEAVMVNRPMLNSMAKSFKTALNWPGVEVKAEQTVVAKPQMEVVD